MVQLAYFTAPVIREVYTEGVDLDIIRTHHNPNPDTIYISGKIEINLTVCKYANIKKQGRQRMILIVVELFANAKC